MRCRTRRLALEGVESVLGFGAQRGGGELVDQAAIGSAALPYLVVILVMVGAQFFQQAYSQVGQPKDDNPQVRATQTITKVLPVLFGVFAWNFVAGLVVYWATSNLFRFGQMAFIYRIDGRPTPAAAAVAKTEEITEPKRPSKPQGSAKKRNRRRRK